MKKKKENKTKTTQETKTRGKCLCCGSSEQGKAISSTGSHGHFPQSSPAPFQRAPLPTGCQGVPCSGHTHKPNPKPTSCLTIQGSQRGSLSQAHPGHLYDSSPGNPHHYAVPISLSSSQPLLGPRSWHTPGPASVTP